ncbi:MAG: prepilin-type N-terminal cleavage/methylation domain-containing protein [Armatimonadota bacterium]
MKVHPIASRIRAPRRGFTLVELLIAIIILLFGVVAALKIFPPGFAAFHDANMETVSQSLRDNGLNSLADDAGSLPDAIWPVEPGVMSSAVTSALNFDDLRAVELKTTPAGAWAGAYTATLSNDWPQWQPLSARILRRVIGEKVIIPSSVNAFTDNANNAFNLSRLPNYVPRFAPIEADTAGALLVYDTRYQNTKNVTDLTDQNESDATLLYFHDDDKNSAAPNVFYFKAKERFVRLTFTCIDTAYNAIQVAPVVWKLPDTSGALPVTIAPHQGRQVVGGTEITATIEDAGGNYKMTLNFPAGGWSVVPGSQQLNRAFAYVNTANLAVMEHLGPREFCLFTLPDPDPQYEAITKTLLSMLIFSKKDSGRKVKIDYIVADWGILHDDVAVDGDGYAALTTAPRLNARANYPREVEPWGLFEPMTGGQPNVVMTLVDLFSSNVFSVECDPDEKNKTYGPLEKGYRTNALLTTGDFSEKLIVDLSDADQKRFRLGVLDGTDADWSALAGQTFRVYYRAQRDWTVQFFRAPAVFGWTNSTDYLGWTNYAESANSLFVPGIYAGQSVAVDYQYRDTAQVTRADTAIVNIAGTDTQVSVLSVNRMGSMAVGDRIAIYHVPTSSYLGAVIHSVNRKERRVVLTSQLSVDAGDFVFIYEDLDNDGLDLAEIQDIPLRRADNELQTISAPDASGVSRARLKHLPAEGTNLTVRGASVAVRTLWTQPRNGEAYVVDDDSAGSFPEKIRTINERWRGKTSVINLPMTGN